MKVNLKETVIRWRIIFKEKIEGKRKKTKKQEKVLGI